MRAVVAIDNGLKGAFCYMSDSQVIVLTTPTGNGKLSRRIGHVTKDNGGRDYRPKQILSLIDEAIAFDPSVQFIVESPPSGYNNYKGDSNRGAQDSLQRGMGVWAGLLGLRDKLMFTVPPQTWKAKYKLNKQPKEASLPLAISMFPSVTISTVDQADAVLIANYFREFEFEIEGRRGNRSKTRT